MTLYEIDAAIMTAIAHGIDPETGEITNLDELMGLQMDRERKIENIACLVKNLKADVKAMKEEAQALTDRRRVVENKVARLEAVLDEALDGQKFSTPRCVVSFRNSKAVEVDDEDALINWACLNGQEDNFVRYRAPEINKANLLRYLKEGCTLNPPGVRLVERRSLGVK
nr:MAG TPA: resistance protein [Bacteriophage sp.]